MTRMQSLQNVLLSTNAAAMHHRRGATQLQSAARVLQPVQEIMFGQSASRIRRATAVAQTRAWISGEDRGCWKTTCNRVVQCVVCGALEKAKTKTKLDDEDEDGGRVSNNKVLRELRV